MSLSSKFGFTNSTASSNKITLTDVDLVSNYALTEDEPTVCKETNTTTPIDQPEVVSFGCQQISSVASSIKNLNPPKVKGGVQYQVKLEELLTTTSDSDASFRVDEPIVAYLTIRHPRSSNVTAEHIQTVVNRLISCLYKSDGTTRFNDLMRSALKPTTK